MKFYHCASKDAERAIKQDGKLNWTNQYKNVNYFVTGLFMASYASEVSMWCDVHKDLVLEVDIPHDRAKYLRRDVNPEWISGRNSDAMKALLRSPEEEWLRDAAIDVAYNNCQRVEKATREVDRKIVQRDPWSLSDLKSREKEIVDAREKVVATMDRSACGLPLAWVRKCADEDCEETIPLLV